MIDLQGQIDELRKRVEKLEKVPRLWEPGDFEATVPCPECGADMPYPRYDTAFTCPKCGYRSGV